MRKGDDGEKKKTGEKNGEKKEKKIMMKIVATNVVASRPPERQGSPATTIARAKRATTRIHAPKERRTKKINKDVFSGH